MSAVRLSALPVRLAPERVRAAVRDYAYRWETVALVVMVASTQLLHPRAPGGIWVLGSVDGFSMAIQAIGIVLVYRTGRFINFAQVQIGLTGAALFAGLVQGQWMLRTTDRLCGCIGFSPSHTAITVNFIIAALLGLVGSVLVSVLGYQVIVRRFANQPRLVVTIATIFAAQALAAFQTKLGGWLVPKWMRATELAQGVQAAKPPSDVTLHISPVVFHVDSIAYVLVGLLAIAGTGVYLRMSSTGSVIRAAAESPDRARTLGVNVESVTSRIWVIVGLLSGAAGIIYALSNPIGLPKDGGDGSAISVDRLVIILAVAVLARLSSLTMVGIGAVVLADLRQAMSWAFGSNTQFDGLIVVIIGVLLMAQRAERTRSDRDDASMWAATREARPIPSQLRSLPSVRKWSMATIGVCAVVVLGLPWAFPPSKTSLLSSFAIYAIIGISLLVLTGWAGQISLGQFGFATVGAWVGAVSHLPFLLAMLVGGLAGAAAALLVGAPALKLRGLHLAISSLAFSLSTSAVFLGTGLLGKRLPASMPRPSFLGMSMADERTFYYFVLVVVVITALAVRGLRNSRTGRVLIAIRDNDAAAQSYGINVLRVKLTAFAFAGFFAAVAGVMLSFDINGVIAQAYQPEVSLEVFTFTVIGGLGGLLGPILGFAYMATLGIAATGETAKQLASGLTGLVVLMALPGGLAQGVYDLRDSMLRRVAARHRILVPSLIADKKASTADGRAPLIENVRAKSGAVFVPAVYEPDGQWALQRYGAADAVKERVGG